MVAAPANRRKGSGRLRPATRRRNLLIVQNSPISQVPRRFWYRSLLIAQQQASDVHLLIWFIEFADDPAHRSKSKER
jgi:hypothetical protein